MPISQSTPCRPVASSQHGTDSDSGYARRAESCLIRPRHEIQRSCALVRPSDDLVGTGEISIESSGRLLIHNKNGDRYTDVILILIERNLFEMRHLLGCILYAEEVGQVRGEVQRRETVRQGEQWLRLENSNPRMGQSLLTDSLTETVQYQ